ncbi:polysaccharide deacetylase family protein [Adhaeribacter soli]|uniref:Polysaccharide deacetylase family protein n=1 Tax=Adhaeribacter soli TaxID=2607655 RepID=A0A5N1J4M9_9BACT|nr:polysaccharide deacetylase family protein [Adhaeribacter soli]KAA9345640.1 polysaccharide deacetylase family protein [Adhaeribacter soli]
MRLFRLPEFIRNLLPQLEWRKSETEPVIYLTFDDGPVPEVTAFVLEQLARFQAKGTFFCVGENLTKYPEIANRVLEQGHRLGNHTFNHLKAWKTASEPYLQNTKKCAEALVPYLTPSEISGEEKPLFRPPYGQISLNKIKQLQPDYRIIMWDLLTCDYDQALRPEACLEASLKYTRNGSIVVFHDSFKARRNLEYVLPRYLEHFHQLGYRFSAL